MTDQEKVIIVTAASNGPSHDFITDKISETAVVGHDAKPTRYDEIEGIGVIGLSDEELDFFYSFTPVMRKRMNRKVRPISLLSL